MLNFNFDSLIQYLQHFGAWGYLIVFLLFFGEALVGIGLVIPGAIIAFLLGATVSRSVFSLQDLMLAGSLGFLAGDLLSYYLGRKGTNFFKPDARFLKLSHLEKGQSFFERHGSKSVFFGRYIGPLRPFTPFIAGLSRMPLHRFLFLNILSIVSWLAIHLLLGYFFGQTLWLVRLWSSRLEALMIYAAIFVGLVWLFKHLIIKNGRTLALIISSVWRSFVEALSKNEDLKHFRARHAKFFSFMSARVSKENFWGSNFTNLTFFFSLCVIAFSLIANNIFKAGALADMDLRIENLMRIFKNFFFMKFFVTVTVLGSWQIIFMLTATASIWFYLRGRQKLWIPLWISVFGTFISVYVLKSLVDRPRPEYSLYIEHSSSFPSAHAALAIAFFGFLYFIYSRKYAAAFNRKVNLFFLTSLAVIFIGLSRLYLRVHFLSDVLAGYLVGLIWLLLAIGFALYYKADRVKNVRAMTPVIKAVLVITALVEIGIYGGMIDYYRSKLNLAQFEPPAETVSTNILNDFKSRGLNKYSESFDGESQEPISFIIAASTTDELAQAFGKIGYTRTDKPNFQALMKVFKKGLLQEPYQNLPLSPTFWETRVNDLSFSKNFEKERHYAAFWQTNFLTPNGKHIYVGIAGAKRPTKLIIKKKMNPNIDGEREAIFEDMKKKKEIASWSRHQFIEPQMVQKLVDDYFTDGKLYIIDLK